MVILDSNTIRVRLDVLSFDAPMDDIRKELIQFWRCNDLRFQLGIFRGDEVVDATHFTALHLSVRSLDGGNPPSGGTASLMLGLATIFDGTMELEDWITGAKQHAEITFSAADNALEAGEYWISFWATTEGGHTLTLGSGVCKVLENGGISLTPPEPRENYYTATECDDRIGEELGSALESYYTAEECDEKFAPIDGESDMDLSNYYTKAETYSQTEVGEILEDYSSKAETDSTLENYYTAEECDEKFALIGSGSGGGNGGGGLVPENKGELVMGNGTGAALLAAGQNRQLLIANPDATLGAEWGNYPWQLLREITIGNSVSAVVFENIFDASLFWHYKLTYSFITTSIDGERLLMVFGYEDDDTTVWETSIDEYSYNTTDFSGSIAKYGTYQFVDGFFGFGNDGSTYRNSGGWMHGEMDLWNDGNVAHKVQARACASAYRVYNDSFIGNGGIYNFIYKNAGAKVIRSLKIYVVNGTLTSGRFTLYGIR
ncbi:MAG: hypothetical protein LBB05_01205 [Puniceicoccales bacterium]|jgi:hypothetical protein|nr:hypothetical protein [Puniceicoccales bacterium]